MAYGERGTVGFATPAEKIFEVSNLRLQKCGVPHPEVAKLGFGLVVDRCSSFQVCAGALQTECIIAAQQPQCVTQDTTHVAISRKGE